MPHVEVPQAEFKVVLLGDSDTGKTSLALRFVEGYYRECRGATIGAFFLTKRLTLDKMTCKLLLWDTAGQEQFQKLAVTYYKHAAAVIICYDVTRSDSIDRLHNWLNQVQQNIMASQQSHVICIAACKTDLVAIPGLEDQVKLLARDYGALHTATSAKADRNVSAVFAQVAEQVLQRQQDSMTGRGRPIAVTMGANLQLPRSPRRMRSLSPTSAPNNTCNSTGGRPRLEERRKSEGAIMSNGALTSNSNHSNSRHVDEKKEDDLVAETDSKMASSPPSIMCDNGLLVCGSDLNASGMERCIIL